MGPLKGVFYANNLLSATDFETILVHKETIVNKRDKSIEISSEGIVTESLDTKVFMGSVVNYQFDIDSFEPYIGKPFIFLMERIKKWLVDYGLNDPKPYMVRCYRNNQITPWHRHGVLSGVTPPNHWVVIYYMHPNWNPIHGGKLNVSIIETEPLYSFDTLSNTIVCHNGYYGHGVSDLKLGYQGDRDLFLSHWVTKQLT
jgi:hypothetical protein